MCKGIPPHHGSNMDTAPFFTIYYYFYLIETNRNWTVFYWMKKKIPFGSQIWGEPLLEFVFLTAQRHQGKLRWISKSDSEINTQLCGPTQGRYVCLPDRPLRDVLLPHPNCSSFWIDTKKAKARKPVWWLHWETFLNIRQTHTSTSFHPRPVFDWQGRGKRKTHIKGCRQNCASTGQQRGR